MQFKINKTAPRTTKYSLMKPPTRKLIGGVRESHTKEYLFQISAQTMGCRGRSKFRAQEQQEHETRSKTRTFEKKERERKKRKQPGVPVWRGQGMGRATWPPGPGVDPPGHPQVLPNGILPGNFYSEFSGFLWATSLWRIFRSSKICKNFR